MRAAIYRGNRSIVVENVERPSPAEGEVEVRIAYTGICGTDLHAFHGSMDARIGLSRVLGHEVSGTIERVGTGAAGFELGDAVVVRPLLSCGSCHTCRAGHAHICSRLRFLGLDSDGGFREFWNVPAQVVHRIRPGSSLRDAALVEPLAVACHDVRRGRVAPGEDVLILGGGPIGLLIAIVARRAGANVHISEPSAPRREICASFGFPTLDPAEEDLAKYALRTTDGTAMDVVFEVSGSERATSAMASAVCPRGRIVVVAIHPQPREVDLFSFFWKEIEMIGARVYDESDFEEALDIIASEAAICADIVTKVADLENILDAFWDAESASSMKTLIKIG